MSDEELTKHDFGEMEEGGVQVFITDDHYVVVQATSEGEDSPKFGIVLPFRAALALGRAIDQAARQAQREGRGGAPQWSEGELN